MGQIPVLKPHEVVTILHALGFIEVRQRGSHKQFRNVAGQFRNAAGKNTTVPFHGGRDIARCSCGKLPKMSG
jgi:predicted RNA binding protein YcfA (HicA-like mRNA interferase family)